MVSALRLDPTRTITLRRQYVAEMRRRFNKVQRLTTQLIMEQDVFGLDTSQPLTLQESIVDNVLPERQAWRFRTNAQKLESFEKWFQEQIDNEILTVDIRGNPWTAKYVGSSYKKGSMRTYQDVRPESMADSLDFYKGRRSQFLEAAFSQPERLSKIQFLYTRSFEELKGITNAMAQQVNRALADGMAHGRGPTVIARNIKNTIAGITKQRAELLARTEVINAHAEGQLDSFEELGVTHVGLMAEWSTAGDDRVCPLCGDLEGAIFTIAEARGLIPRHPNCRCAWIPANVDEVSDKELKTARGATRSKVNRSLKRELPKKTRAGVKVPQTIKEAKRRSTWPGKDVTGLPNPPRPPAAPPVPAPADPVPDDTFKGWSKVKQTQAYAKRALIQVNSSVHELAIQKGLSENEVRQSLNKIVKEKMDKAQVMLRIDNEPLKKV